MNDTLVLKTLAIRVIATRFYRRFTFVNLFGTPFYSTLIIAVYNNNSSQTVPIALLQILQIQPRSLITTTDCHCRRHLLKLLSLTAQRPTPTRLQHQRFETLLKASSMYILQALLPLQRQPRPHPRRRRRRRHTNQVLRTRRPQSQRRQLFQSLHLLISNALHQTTTPCSQHSPIYSVTLRHKKNAPDLFLQNHSLLNCVRRMNCFRPICIKMHMNFLTSSSITLSSVSTAKPLPINFNKSSFFINTSNNENRSNSNAIPTKTISQMCQQIMSITAINTTRILLSVHTHLQQLLRQHNKQPRLHRRHHRILPLTRIRTTEATGNTCKMGLWSLHPHTLCLVRRLRLHHHHPRRQQGEYWVRMRKRRRKRRRKRKTACR